MTSYTVAIQRDSSESVSGAAPILDVPMPERIDRYRLLRALGHGGQGVVYEAHDPELDRNVAIKLLRAGAGRRHATRRLLREATALAQLSHPNVVGVHHVGQTSDGVYVVAQLVHGVTLCDWLRTARTWREIVAVFVAAGRGLIAAHEREIIHRDFKPANVLVGSDGVVRLVDFGLARDAAHDGGTASRSAWDSSACALTLDGVVMGTPSYMAPEQHDGTPATVAADQYAFCVALFEALWKQRPFAGHDVATLAAQKRAGALPFPSHDLVPRRLRAIVVTGLQPRADRRWASMRALVEALERAASPRRQVMRWAALAGVLAGAIVWATSAVGDPPATCAAREAFTEVWSPSRASALASAFALTDRSYADDAALRVRDGVDAFGATWIAEREAACSALDTDPSADARLACLDTRLDELAAALGVLEENTPQAIEHAVETIAGLPNPRRCAAPDRSAPSDDIAGRVTQIRRAIARADALQRAGRYDAALSEVERAQSLAVAIDHAPTIAEAALGRSTILEAMGSYAEAHAQGEYAYFAAHAVGHDELAFKAAWGLALSARLVGSGDADEWVRRAEGTLARLGDDADPMLPGVLAYMFAALALQAGDYPSALEHAREATAILERELGAADYRVTLTMVASTTALASLHRLDEAEAEARKTIASAEAAMGATHPFTADAMILLAIVMQQRGALADALAMHRRVLEHQEAALDPQSPALATTWLNIGNVEDELGHAEAAEQALRRALAIARSSLDPDNAACVGILHNLALTLSRRGAQDEAIAAWREALDIGGRQLGNEHPHVGDVLASLGEALADAGRIDEGVPMIERALAIRRATLGDGDPNVADGLRALARAQRLGGQLEQSQHNIETALEIVVAARGVEDLETAGIRHERAELLAAQGHLGDARSENDRAIELVARHLGEDHPDVAYMQDRGKAWSKPTRS